MQIITTTSQVDDVTHRLLLAMGVAGALIVLIGALAGRADHRHVARHGDNGLDAMSSEQ